MLRRITFQINAGKLLLYSIWGSLTGTAVGAISGILYGARTTLSSDTLLYDTELGATTVGLAGMATGAILSTLSLRGNDPVDENNERHEREARIAFDVQLLAQATNIPTENENRLIANHFDLNDVPDELCDPITKRIFQHPVKTELNQTYEISSIPFLHGVCSLTRLPFNPTILTPDTAMIATVNRFIQEQETSYQQQSVLITIPTTQSPQNTEETFRPRIY